jgi:hypothetical protein
MPLNVQSIDKNIYFEFYLNDNLLYRYNYNTDELEISLKELCYYLTQYIFKYYRYKRITGNRYNHNTVLWFYMLIHLHPTVADINQTEEVSKAYPLDLQLSEADFCNNLYLNIVWLSGELLQKESYIKELKIFKELLPTRSTNLFWKAFPTYEQQLSNYLNVIVDKGELEVSKLLEAEEPTERELEATITFLSFQIELLQEQSINVLNCYDEIMSQYSRFVRLSRYSKHSIQPIDSMKEFAKQKLKDYFNYFQGNFSLVKQPELIICNKYMAHSFFLPFTDDYKAAKNFEEYLQSQANYMLSEKNGIIDKLNKLQQQAIILWNK